MNKILKGSHENIKKSFLTFGHFFTETVPFEVATFFVTLNLHSQLNFISGSSNVKDPNF